MPDALTVKLVFAPAHSVWLIGPATISAGGLTVRSALFVIVPQKLEMTTE